MHLDHLPGSFFGPSNLVALLRHRASHQAGDRAFTYLVDGEDEENGSAIKSSTARPEPLPPACRR